MAFLILIIVLQNQHSTCIQDTVANPSILKRLEELGNKG